LRNEKRLLFAKSRFDQILDLNNGFFRIDSFGVDGQFGALASGEHHEAHDTFAIDPFPVFFNPYLGAVAAGNFYKHGRWAGVKTISVINDNFPAASLHIV
jgi:hypothetical protein